MKDFQNVEKKRWKLEDEEISELTILFCDKGWRINRIAKKLEIHFSSVLYWIKRLELKRKVPIVSSAVQKQTRVFLASTRPKGYQTYADIAKKTSQEKCQHAFWIKKCSCCGKILESDSSYLEKERGIMTDIIPERQEFDINNLLP